MSPSQDASPLLLRLEGGTKSQRGKKKVRSTHMTHTPTSKKDIRAIAALCGALLLVLVPASASALPGASALSRSSVGQSRSNQIANVTTRVTFASEQPEVPENASSHGNVASSTPTAQAGVGAGSNQNGGSQGADGGAGGSGGAGGLVRAGNVVTNATAVNAINTVIVRITIR